MSNNIIDKELDKIKITINNAKDPFEQIHILSNDAIPYANNKNT